MISTTAFLQPTPVTDVDLAFPARGVELTPVYEAIPRKFRTEVWDNLWLNLFRDVFAGQADELQLLPAAGVDPDQAWRHLRVVMGTFGTKHEHKEIGWVWLASRWFCAARWKHQGMDYQVGEWSAPD